MPLNRIAADFDGVLNEVLSITAQEYTLVRRTKLIKQLLNEVLSITAQECGREASSLSSLVTPQ